MPTGEHGVAVETHDLMPVMFKYGLNQQQRLKCSFDPAQILNPAKSSRSRKVGGERSLSVSRRSPGWWRPSPIAAVISIKIAPIVNALTGAPTMIA